MQGMKQQFSILTSVTMAMILTACSYSDISLEEHADSNATATERIPITLNAPSVRTETTVTDTRAADNGYVSSELAVWCVPVGKLGETTETAYNMQTAEIPLKNVKATFSTDQSYNTLTLDTSGGNYYYPATDARYTFYAYQPISDGCGLSVDGGIEVLFTLNGKNNILWSKSETPTDDAAYAYSAAYWQRNHNAAAPKLQTFKHIMAAVTVKVTTPTGSAMAGISLEDMSKEASMNLREGTIGEFQPGDIAYKATTNDLFPSSSQTNEAEYTFYVLPQHGELKLKIEYTKDGEATAPTYTTNAILLEAGKEYTITINIDE